MRKAVFFDLDGTLLPFEMSDFADMYFSRMRKNGLLKRISEENGEQIFEKALFSMIYNDGSKLNSEAFFGVVEDMSGVKKEEIAPLFNEFYQNEFKEIQSCTSRDNRVVETIEELKRKGFRLILSTNPVFPEIATDQRIRWAGLDPKDFEYISYYDNSRYCKPNLEYYNEILKKTGLSAQECYIVGNDTGEDMCAVDLGFKGFLVLDHIIGDVERAPQCERGNYSDLLEFARSLEI